MSNESFKSMVPEAHREKPWLKELVKTDRNHFEEVFNQYENAQKLIGTRTGISVPGEQATVEEIQAFHKALGVPDDHVAGYALQPTTWQEADKELGAMIEASRPEAFINDLKAVAKAEGMTPKQFQAMASAYDQAWIKHQRESLEEIKAADINFDALANQQWGADKGKVLDQANKLYEQLLPPDSPWRTFFHQQPNEVLIGVAALMQGVRTNFMKEDAAFGKKVQGSGAMSDTQWRDEGRRMQAELANMDPMDHRYDSMREAVTAHYSSRKR